MKSSPIDVRRVRQLFSQPEKLKAADFIHREIAARMSQRLELIRLAPTHILDAGCGRGADLNALKTRFPDAHVIGLDASYALLNHALKAESGAVASLSQLIFAWVVSKLKTVALRDPSLSRTSFSLINGDFGRLPLADRSTDMIWSNLALHWHPEPDQVFKEWQRVLRVDGLLMFSCFGPDSFKEIRQAFRTENQSASLAPHTLPFVDMHDYGDLLIDSGFATPVMDMEIITLTYETVAQLLTEVRSVGGNPLQNRHKGLMGKAAWRQMCANLELLRNSEGRIPLTLEIIYGHAFKPVAKKNKPGESIVEFKRWKK